MSDVLRPGRTQPGRVFDVRRPGRAPATATSRPIIVGNKPEVQDPMNVPVSNVTPSAPEVPPQTQPQSQAIFESTVEVPEQAAPVVADAANALHPPHEPLLMPQNSPEPSDLGLEDSGLAPEAPATEVPSVSPSAPHPSTQNLPIHEDQLPDLHELSPLSTDHQENTLAGKAVVSHHRGSWVPILLKTFGILVLLAILSAIVLDILMDGGFVVLKGVPHTHFF